MQPLLAIYGAQAEATVFTNPNAALIQAGQFGEVLAAELVSRTALRVEGTRRSHRGRRPRPRHPRQFRPHQAGPQPGGPQLEDLQAALDEFAAIAEALGGEVKPDTDAEEAAAES
ncbi:hypothetical protein OG735_23135 [Streptomyces sp. NBC_01210]|uniref:hypothetical protein n=1 Tax=Streptomyces sp. NBC_01210 TaxID=2903774 RepID=UPI002E0D9811|nr:hypothetical protein OG735_23135 [Streptomyces sp. NBC_01210]